ncbi:MAG: bifunctional UDP-N-acetylglucosamine diphosphorylase/glucosamine-1-phosphate N-acetyltransferase GlmU [Coriobacteriia bacterium]|nr:bifunctional UDP-N-acetylglucosamine diphosphorylase/glucosamine-1-phosphate N-acetyltransferase GlmU [Coriobacteriia bacterium]
MKATAIILAAGEGTRMNSDMPKVAHEVLGVSIIEHVVAAAQAAGVDRVVVVTGHKADVVEALLPGLEFARQNEQHGTGHAVMCALEAVGEITGPVVILAGDVPLIRPETIASLVETAASTKAGCVVLSARFPDPTGYGRIIRSVSGEVTGITEHKDLPAELLYMDECNVGSYCFDGAALSAHLHRLEASNAQAEYYLTDLVALFAIEGLGVRAVITDDVDESHGVNSRVQLAEVTRVLQRRINERHMLAGVTMISPESTWIAPGVKLGRDVIIEPMTFLMGEVSVGDRAHLGPNTRITDSTIGADVRVDSSIVLGAVVGVGASVGPVAYLRPGAVLAARAKAGACVEIKNSTVGESSKVPHLSYIGDATIGSGVNVGAGTITCNYDGVAKHRTVIEDGVFIGSDTMLVAPVRIGEGAITGAGSAIARDVPAGALGIERTEQRNVTGFAERRRKQTKRDE